VGTLCEIPVGPKAQRRLIPIITDEYPDPTFGAGAVKITGAHDFNDYAVAKRNGIPLYVLMDGKARMRPDGLSYEESAAIATRAARGEDVGDVAQVNLVPEDLRGLDRLEARAKVVEQVTAEGLAVMVPADDPRLGRAAGASGRPGESFEEGGVPPELHEVPLVEPKPVMQPFGDRSGVVIEPMLTDQWFVDTARIVQPAIDAVRDGRTAILPERDAKVYFHWLENIEPWCISRQLWWGHRVPVWWGPAIKNVQQPGYAQARGRTGTTPSASVHPASLRRGGLPRPTTLRPHASLWSLWARPTAGKKQSNLAPLGWRTCRLTIHLGKSLGSRSPP
jgi:valyl-tRNA synthetase